MNRVWQQDTNGALSLFREIHILLALFERCAKIEDRDTCIWCHQEISRILFKACMNS